MYSKFAIFAAISLSLVTVGYSSFATNEACALPPDPKWGGKNSTCKTWDYGDGVLQKKCCWLNDDGKTLTCQTCVKDSDTAWDCTAAWNKAPGDILPDDEAPPTIKDPQTTTEPKVPREDILPDEDEPTINDPPTTIEPKVPREDILPDETDEDDPTINDPQTTTEPKIKEPGKIEFPNLK